MSTTYIDRTEFRRNIRDKEHISFGFTVRRKEDRTAFCSWESPDKVPKDNMELFRLAVQHTPDWDWRDLIGYYDTVEIDGCGYTFRDYESEEGTNLVMFSKIIKEEMEIVNKEMKTIAEGAIAKAEKALKEHAGTGYRDYYDNHGTVGSRWVPIEQEAMWILRGAMHQIRTKRPEAQEPDPEADAQVAIVRAAAERLGIIEWEDSLG